MLAHSATAYKLVTVWLVGLYMLMNQPVPDEPPKPNGAEASTIAPCSVSTLVPPLKPPPEKTVPEWHFATNCLPVLGGKSVAGPNTSVDTTPGAILGVVTAPLARFWVIIPGGEGGGSLLLGDKGGSGLFGQNGKASGLKLRPRRCRAGCAIACCSGKAYTIVDRPAATINVTATFVVWFIVLKADITFQYISNASPLVLELLVKLWIYWYTRISLYHHLWPVIPKCRV